MNTEDSNSTPQTDRDKLNEQLDELRKDLLNDDFVYNVDRDKTIVLCYQIGYYEDNNDNVGWFEWLLILILFPFILLIFLILHPVATCEGLYSNVLDDIKGIVACCYKVNERPDHKPRRTGCVWILGFWSVIVALALLFWGWRALRSSSDKTPDSPAPTAIESVTPVDKQTSSVSPKAKTHLTE